MPILPILRCDWLSREIFAREALRPSEARSAEDAPGGHLVGARDRDSDGGAGGSENTAIE